MVRKPKITVKQVKQNKLNKINELAMARRKNNKKGNKKTVKVAVYGTLLSTLGLNYILKTSTLMGEFQTPPSLQMYSAGGFPYIMSNGTTSVSMEVYDSVNEEVLSALDRVEGVAGGLYTRSEIDTPFGKAFAYMRNSKMGANDPVIASGSWKDFIGTQKANKLHMN